MRPFDELTERGRIARLRALARVALSHYDDSDDDRLRVSLLRQTFNTLFRAVDHEGAKTALRVGARQRIHTEATEAVETAWLLALRAETDIGAPLPIANRAGATVTVVETAGVPEPRACVRFEWISGRRLSEVIDDRSAERAGVLLARLHEHGAGFDGGRRQPVLVADTVTQFRLPVRIPRADPTYGTLFAEACDRAQRAIDALWADPPHPPHLLHGDFHGNNILVWRGRPVPIDFQDLTWGFEVQDIAITVRALDRLPDPDALAASIRAGYERVRPWPADDAVVHELIGARHLAELNLGYNLRRPGFDEFVARHAAWLQDWMAS